MAASLDNERALAYMWSSELPLIDGFSSPHKARDDRESYVVVGSDNSALDHSVVEKRHVY